MLTTQATTALRPNQRSQLLSAIDGVIEPIPVSGVYRFGLFFVAGGMLLLAVAYLVLIVFTTYGVYWHATHNYHILTQPGGGIFRLLLYFGPLLVGPIVALFMIKPLFAPAAVHQRPRRLKQDVEPFLFEWVDRICKAVNAPTPKSIRISCEPNAYAGFRRGFGSLFSNDLTLMIGLPLVSGLTLRQLSGVLAHEFGHFSQGTAMRLYFVIRTLNHWFAQVVYERDIWDMRLWYWSKRFDLRLSWIFYLARCVVWITRWLLWGLMQLGNMISGFMSRQMEFDADRYEAHLSGSNEFSITVRRLRDLNIAWIHATDDMQQFFDEGRLADDLPALIQSNIDLLTPEHRRAFIEQQHQSESSLFSTHPSDKERIASARAEEATGILNLPESHKNASATILFSNFKRLSRATSLQFYRENLGDEVDKSDLHPVEELLERRQVEIDSGKALRRYFQTEIPIFQPLPLTDDANEAPTAIRETATALRDARERMLAKLAKYETLRERIDKSYSVMLDTTAALSVLRTGFRINPSKFNLKSVQRDDINDRNHSARRALENISAQMLPFESAAGERLSLAMQLLRAPKIVSMIEGGEDLQTEMEDLLPKAQFLNGLMDELPTFRILYAGLAPLCEHIEGNEDNQRLIEAILDRTEKMYNRLKLVYKALGKQRYPFDHAKEDMTLRDYVFSIIPEPDDLHGIVGVAGEMIERMAMLQVRLFARLAFIAEKVESAVGLSELPDPDQKEAEKQKTAAKKKRVRQNVKVGDSRSIEVD